jgi:DNA helicase HerA-like ATPase
LYLPAKQLADASGIKALNHFERIAKEGRKYGVSLTIISQRPSEINTNMKKIPTLMRGTRIR